MIFIKHIVNVAESLANNTSRHDTIDMLLVTSGVCVCVISSVSPLRFNSQDYQGKADGLAWVNREDGVLWPCVVASMNCEEQLTVNSAADAETHVDETEMASDSHVGSDEGQADDEDDGQADGQVAADGASDEGQADDADEGQADGQVAADGGASDEGQADDEDGGQADGQVVADHGASDEVETLNEVLQSASDDNVKSPVDVDNTAADVDGNTTMVMNHFTVFALFHLLPLH